MLLLLQKLQRWAHLYAAVDISPLLVLFHRRLGTLLFLLEPCYNRFLYLCDCTSAIERSHITFISLFMPFCDSEVISLVAVLIVSTVSSHLTHPSSLSRPRTKPQCISSLSINTIHSSLEDERTMLTSTQRRHQS